MLWSIAWRNLWRSRKRSATILVAIAFGLWAGLFTGALVEGYSTQMVRDAINDRTAHLQIHKPDFLAHRDIADVIPDGGTIYRTVSDAPLVAGSSYRNVVSGMARSATAAAGITLIGIDPDVEHTLFEMDSNIIEGTYFDTERARNPCIIGRKLADKLKLKVGNKLVVQGQAFDGSLTAGAFRIVGIYKTVNSMFDQSNVFAIREDVDQAFRLDGQFHSIMVRAETFDSIDPLQAELQRELPDGTVEVMTWDEVEPDIGYMKANSNQMSMIFLVIILLALIFGITNTMLMAVLERIRELGVLMALGMRLSRIFIMIMLETLALCVLGGVFGMILSLASIAIWGHVGIDLSAVGSGLEAAGMSAIMYPSLSVHQYVSTTIMVLVTAFLAAIYPGWKATRLSPVDAIRTY